MSTSAVANRLAELCRVGKYHEAMLELYADDARHIEGMEMPGCPRIVEGKPALLKLSEHFGKTVEVHSSSVGTPLINGEQFIVEMGMDCTHGEGPMAGQRMNMSEQCLYTVKNGRITEAKFFYPGC
jgi:ketosteroid isomerase-like protein